MGGCCGKKADAEGGNVPTRAPSGVSRASEAEDFDETKSNRSFASGVSTFFTFKKCEEEAKSEKTTFHDAYFLGEKINQTAHAQVHVAARLKTDKAIHRAVKVVDLRLANPKFFKIIEKEINVWKKVGKHEHCVRLFDVFYGSSLCYMVMEKCNSSFLKYLERIPGLNEQYLGKVFHQILTALRHLHVFRVVHRDIRPENLLVGGEDGNTIKISDFGLAVPLPKDDSKLTDEVGTAPFMCPEMYLGLPYTEKADIWSFGVLVYCLLFGRYPHKVETMRSTDLKKSFALMKAGDTFSFRGKCSCRAVAFSMFLLTRDPASRPSAESALELTYMTTVHGEKMNLALYPSLNGQLLLAKRAKVFDVTNHQENPGIDDILSHLQLQKHGKGLPAATDSDSMLRKLGRSTTSKSMRAQGTNKTSVRTSSAESRFSSASEDSEDEDLDWVSEGSSACSV